MKDILRNDPCPCGSGKKYKRCCGINAAKPVAASRATSRKRAVPIVLSGNRSVSPAEAMQAAIVCHQAGELAEALAIYARILQVEPGNADALHLSGLAAHQAGDHWRAVASIRSAISIKPGVAIYHNNLGRAYLAIRQIDNAIGESRQAVELDPKLPQAHYNLGLALRTKNKVAESIPCFERALSLKPDFADAHINLGESLLTHGEVELAATHCERALALSPNSVEAHVTLADALEKLRQYESAVAHCQLALVLGPETIDLRIRLGNLFAKLDKWETAGENYGRALVLDPNNAGAHNNLASALVYQGRLTEAINHYKTALALDPSQPRMHSNLLLTLNYIPGIDAGSLYTAHMEFDRLHGRPLGETVLAHSNNESATRRLRVGYVSSSFCQHSVAHFIEPVLAQHDHEQFEIYCYSNQNIEDSVTQRLRLCADVWRRTEDLTDENVAQQIRDDQIDILVDLDGHSGMNRLPIFARKPAPVQVTWIGYPNTTGLSAIDYRITDGYADPVGMTEEFHSEKLLRLPDCFSCYRPPQDCVEVSDLPAFVKGFVTYGSFNTLAKINAEVMTLWAHILNRVPASRLVLKNRLLGVASTRRTIQEFFSSAGVSADRLSLLGHSQGQAAHLEHYSAVDIGLDPFPYNGTTTTCDALWMGVPVITLAGNSHVSRVGVSQMTAIGLPELVAQSGQEYMAIAVALAGDVRKLGELRNTLRSKMLSSPLTDAARLTSNLEGIYRGIWRNWCESQKGK